MVGLMKWSDLSGFLIIIALTKIYRFFLWKFIHFGKSVPEGVFAQIKRNAQYHYMPLWSVIFTRTLVIKCRSKTRNQTFGLMKWLDCKTTKKVTSLSHDLQKSIGSFSGNLLVQKKVSLVNSFRISHGTVTIIRYPCDKISSLEYWS